MSGRFLKTDLPIFFNECEFGDIAVYRSAGGAARNVRVIADLPEEAFSLSIENARVVGASTMCLAPACDFPAGPPLRGDALRLKDTDYVVIDARPDLSTDVLTLYLNLR